MGRPPPLRTRDGVWHTRAAAAAAGLAGQSSCTRSAVAVAVAAARPPAVVKRDILRPALRACRPLRTVIVATAILVTAR